MKLFPRLSEVKILRFLALVVLFYGISCTSSKNEETENPWIGSWQMVGYDQVSVANRDTIVIMQLDENKKIHYITQTRSGEILLESEGEFSINNQHSVLSVIEDGQPQVEYFIRKIDKDSFIFQSDTFSIKWKRID
jgi:hypothetical protein